MEHERGWSGVGKVGVLNEATPGVATPGMPGP